MLTLSRLGAARREDDGEPFEEKWRPSPRSGASSAEAERLEVEIESNLDVPGYGG